MTAVLWDRVTKGEAVTRDHVERADVAIIGTGAGGAVTAATLAEAGLDVVMIEEGPYALGDEMNGDALASFDRLYRAAGLSATLGNAGIALPTGRCVGGTTTINSGSCYRAPDYLLDEWVRGGLDNMRPEAMAPFFDEIEKALDVKPTPEENLGEGAKRFRAGAEKLGYAGAPIPRNERGCRATGVCAFGCPRDAKQAMHVSYVPRALAAGARLFTNCKADRVMTDRGRAVGVLARFSGVDGRENGASLRLVARAVFVAAGAIHTPRLLARSGVVNRDHLGRHLRIHPAVRVAALFDEPIDAWKGVPQSYNIHHFTREGFFIQGQFTPPGVEASMLPYVGARHARIMDAYDRLASFGALISDHSEGRVIGKGSGEPLLWYRMNREDLRTLLRAASVTARVFIAAGAREVFPCVRQRPAITTMTEAADLEHLRAKPSDLDMMAFHPMGTARMGTTGDRGVTDAVGAVHGWGGLYVADGALMPSSTKVNPQITIMAAALRNARAYVESTIP